MLHHKGQTSTEYLVLLAVVLLIAVVGVVLLGDVLGTGIDARLSSSKAYWASASPLAITDASIWRLSIGLGISNKTHYPTIKIKNTGHETVYLRGFISNKPTWSSGPGLFTYYDFYYINGSSTVRKNFYDNPVPIGPGQTICFGPPATGCKYAIVLKPLGGTSDSLYGPEGLSSICRDDNTGVATIDQFGFEYFTIGEDGAPVAKSFVGKAPLILPCSRSCVGFSGSFGGSCYFT
jgi:hypothetical protein